MKPYEKKNVFRKIKIWTAVVVVLAIYVWAFAGAPIIEIKETALAAMKGMFNGLIHPDWGYVYDPEGEDLLRSLLETFAIAVLGTFISAILCIPFALVAARNISKSRTTSSFFKVVLSAIRVFPELILALIFIKAVGLGPAAGIMALGLHSIGMLGKLISEAIEDLDLSATESIVASGGNKLQVLWFAVLPAVLPAFLSYTLYRFEISVRAAAILGIVGAGGIGAPLIFALNGHSWDRVGIILIGIVVMVTIIDVISASIRRRIV